MNKFINNRWNLMEYLNTSDLEGINAEVAKYLYENHDKLLTQSVNRISLDSYFSQSTLSRFFTQFCNTNLNDYRKCDSEGMGYTRSYFKYLNEFSFESFKENLEENIRYIEKNHTKLEKIVKELQSHKRILILGHAHPLDTTYLFQSTLLYYNHPTYAPYNYLAQEKFARDMDENDMIIGLVLDEIWISSPIVAPFKNILKDSKAYKVAVVPSDNTSSGDYFDETLALKSDRGVDNYMSLILLFQALTEMIISKHEKHDDIE